MFYAILMLAPESRGKMSYSYIPQLFSVPLAAGWHFATQELYFLLAIDPIVPAMRPAALNKKFRNTRLRNRNSSSIIIIFRKLHSNLCYASSSVNPAVHICESIARSHILHRQIFPKRTINHAIKYTSLAYEYLLSHRRPWKYISEILQYPSMVRAQSPSDPTGFVSIIALTGTEYVPCVQRYLQMLGIFLYLYTGFVRY